MKAVSELFAPVTGEVVEVNAALKDKPEAVNTDPHDSWMVVIKLGEPGEAGALLDADAVRRAREVEVGLAIDMIDDFDSFAVPPHRTRRGDDIADDAARPSAPRRSTR